MMTPKGARDKGANFERLVANIFKQLFPSARRGGFMQAQDPSGTADVTGTPLWIECKCQKKVSLNGAIRQAKEAAGTKLPVVVSKGTREAIIASMHIDDFIELLSHIYPRINKEDE